MAREQTRRHRESAIGVDAALERILTFFAPLPPEEMSLLGALGTAAAADVVAPSAVPPFRNSAMDGYAVRSLDTAEPPATLSVVGEIVAGHHSGRAIGRGETMRIMTGAPVPDGADAVVRFEEVHERGDHITLARRVAQDENVRSAGEDIAAGATVVRAGVEMTAGRIAALAAVGVPRVRVRRRPRVAILSTGDELIGVGAPLVPGAIWDTNSVMLAALARQAGGTPTMLGVARDAAAEIRARLASAEMPDLIVTSGGVSVGDFDVVKDVLSTDGVIDLWQVAMKPGRPLAFGTLGATPLLGLPGNPAAAFVSFLQFGWPAIRRMLGFDAPRLPEVSARLETRLTNRVGRRTFARGARRFDGATLTVAPVESQGSAMLSGLVDADCLIVVPEDREAIEAGEIVRIQLLPNVEPAPGSS